MVRVDGRASGCLLVARTFCERFFVIPIGERQQSAAMGMMLALSIDFYCELVLEANRLKAPTITVVALVEL